MALKSTEADMKEKDDGGQAFLSTFQYPVVQKKDTVECRVSCNRCGGHLLNYPVDKWYTSAKFGNLFISICNSG